MTNIDNVLKQKPEEIIKFITNNYCPSDFGLLNHNFCKHGATCGECWNQAIKEAETK